MTGEMWRCGRHRRREQYNCRRRRRRCAELRLLACRNKRLHGVRAHYFICMTRTRSLTRVLDMEAWERAVESDQPENCDMTDQNALGITEHLVLMMMA